MVAALADAVDGWHIAGLADAGPRGEPVEAFAGRLLETAAAGAAPHRDVDSALAAAIADAAPDGRVLVLGSFHAAAAALRQLG